MAGAERIYFVETTSREGAEAWRKRKGEFKPWKQSFGTNGFLRIFSVLAEGFFVIGRGQKT